MRETIKLTQEFKHNHRERLCYYCNQLQNKTHDIQRYTIKNRVGKSLFAHEQFTIQLCKDCVQDLEIDAQWFDNDECYNYMDSSYCYERYILAMVREMPIENQEYILNSYNALFCSHANDKRVSREDWIKDNS